MERILDDEKQDFHLLKPNKGRNKSTHGQKAEIMYKCILYR